MGLRRARSGSVYFSEGVLSEILYRLPPKLAFRFKCVSKSWLSLISDPCFPRARARALLLQQQQQPPCWTILFPEVTDVDHAIESALPHQNSFLHNLDASHLDPELLTVSAVSFPSRIHAQVRPLSLCREIAAISNGLLLCRLYREPKWYYDQLYYCIINPLTWQCIELPPLIQDRSPNHLMLGEGFLAQLEGGCTGTVVERYIIVLPLKSHENEKIKRHCFAVFSSQIGEWRDFVVDSPQPYVTHWRWRSLALNERIHWYSFAYGCEELVAYDPLNHPNSCHVIKFPSDGKSRDLLCGLDAFEGRLRCICSVHTNGIGYCLQVWTLSNFKAGDWTLLHRIAQNDLYAEAAASINWPTPMLLYFIPQTNPNPNLLHFRGMKHPKELVSYNIETRECKVVDGVELDLSRWHEYHLFVLPSWPTTIPTPNRALRLPSKDTDYRPFHSHMQLYFW